MKIRTIGLLLSAMAMTLSANSDVENLAISVDRLSGAVNIVSKSLVKTITEQKSIKSNTKTILYKQLELEKKIQDNADVFARKNTEVSNNENKIDKIANEIKNIKSATTKQQKLVVEIQKKLDLLQMAIAEKKKRTAADKQYGVMPIEKVNDDDMGALEKFLQENDTEKEIKKY